VHRATNADEATEDADSDANRHHDTDEHADEDAHGVSYDHADADRDNDAAGHSDGHSNSHGTATDRNSLADSVPAVAVERPDADAIRPHRDSGLWAAWNGGVRCADRGRRARRPAEVT
jgi:hypothetical protein